MSQVPENELRKDVGKPPSLTGCEGRARYLRRSANPSTTLNLMHD